MIEMLEILQELADKAAKGIPEDVREDLKELAKLQADVSRCMMHNQTIDHQTITRINELTKKHFHAAEENVKPNEKPETFDFGEAIRRVKGGARVAREGWNGKEQYIELATELSYWMKSHGTVINVNNEDIGSKAIAFVGTRGIQVGWLASQADMLADDWYEVKPDGRD